MNKWIVLSLSIIFSAFTQAKECNSDVRQSLWIETLHLSAKKSEKPARVFYQAQTIWSTAMPELGLISYWTENKDIAEHVIVIKAANESINEVLPLKKVTEQSWRPSDNLQGYITSSDLGDVIKKIFIEHKKSQLEIEVRLDQELLCRHRIDISSVIDQE